MDHAMIIEHWLEGFLSPREYNWSVTGSTTEENIWIALVTRYTVNGLLEVEVRFSCTEIGGIAFETKSPHNGEDIVLVTITSKKSEMHFWRNMVDLFWAAYFKSIEKFGLLKTDKGEYRKQCPKYVAREDIDLVIQNDDIDALRSCNRWEVFFGRKKGRYKPQTEAMMHALADICDSCRDSL